MIEISISSQVPTSPHIIASIVKVECKITENVTVNKDGKIRQGYTIEIVGDIPNEIFLNEIWFPLRSELKLECARIHEHGKYMGCILNWPGMFTANRCVHALPTDRNTTLLLEENVNSTKMVVTKPSTSIG